MNEDPGSGGLAPRGRCALAAAASLAVLALMLALSEAVRVRASRGSHALPEPEAWTIPATTTSAAMVASGREAFLQNCAHCHGADATGDEGPDLHALEVSDRYIRNTISRGIKGEMPSFRKVMKPEDYANLTAYLRGLD